MSEGYRKILLVTDGSDAAKAAEESALHLATRDGAEVVIADTIRAQGIMEKWLVRNSAEMFQMLEKDKQTRLDALAQEFSSQGVASVDTALLHGKSSEQITREVMRRDCDLLVRYKKGRGSRQRGLFGATALNLLRDCPCPILLVKENQPVTHPKILACTDVRDGDRVNDVIIREAERIKGSESPPLGVLYCWAIFGHHMVRSHMSPANYEKMCNEVKQEHVTEFDKFLQKHGLDRSAPEIAIEFGHPEHIIGPYVKEHGVHVTVMSTVSPDTAVNRFLGSTIENVLRDLPSNLLAVKPVDFEPPFKVK